MSRLLLEQCRAELKIAEVKLSNCMQSLSPTNQGETVSPDGERIPLMPNEQSGSLEKKAHSSRKELYNGCKIIGSIILFLIIGYFGGGLIYNTYKSKNLIKTLHWYFGGALKDGVQSKPTILEVIFVSAVFIAYFVICSTLIKDGGDLLEKEKQYYDEIQKPYNVNSKYGKEQCTGLKDNKLSSPVRALTVISIFSFIAMSFVYIDQVDSRVSVGNSQQKLPINLIVWWIITFIGCLGSLIMAGDISKIREWSDGEYNYKCDKYFI